VTLVKIRKYKIAHAGKLHLKERKTMLQWIRALIIAMGILAVAWPATVLAPELFNVPFNEHYYPIELLLVLFSYWVVFYGYYKVKTISVKSLPGENSLDVDIEKHLTRLLRAMEEEKLYLDTELSVNKLASLIEIPAKTISTVLNQHRQISFNDFVNGYRIKEVQVRLADPNNRHLTISGIAIDCGFNSQATFQRVFKNQTGMSPREFMNQQSVN
jgi:AraC-like DNA-binding protein